MKVDLRSDQGAAIIEFLVVGVLVLVPLLYGALTITRVEAAALASTQAVREVGRVLMMADTEGQGRRAADAAVDLAFEDQGFAAPSNALNIDCSPRCLAPGSTVRVRVSWRIELPWLPQPLGGWMRGYPISAERVFRVDAYRSDLES